MPPGVLSLIFCLTQVPRCPDHGKEMTLFCKETQCQTLICSACMKEHKKHELVDVDEEKEEQKEELLTDLTTTIDTLSSRKNLITPAQITVDGKNNECLGRLRDDKEKTLSMMRDKFDSLIAVATNQKKESRSEMTLLDENLALLNNIKLHVDKEALTLEDVKNCQETASSIIQHTNHTLFEPRNYLHLEYKDCKGKERLVEQLCGELIKKQYLPESGQSIDVTTEAGSAIPAGSPQTQCDVEDASSVQQAGSGDEETEGNVSSEIEETTDSASTSSQSGSVSEEDEEPEGSASGGMEETTGTLNAVSLAETEEASASTSSQNDQVLLSKFQRKFYVFGIK